MIKKLNVIILFSLLAIIYLSSFIPYSSIIYYLKYNLFKQDKAKIQLNLVNPLINKISAEPSNKILLKGIVKDLDGNPLTNVKVSLTCQEKIGKVSDIINKTNESGECMFSYAPSDYFSKHANLSEKKITLTAKAFDNKVVSSTEILLIKPPIVCIYGYQEKQNIFNNLTNFLENMHYNIAILNYNTRNGVASASLELQGFLEKQRNAFLAKGIQVNKFMLIAHSLGGLVSRYYTCQENYPLIDNIGKMIFISVPNKGTHIAALGKSLFEDQSIKDLIPDSEVLSKVLPKSINKGLNNYIQTGNILAQFDEAVTFESASLEEWGIKTQLINVGDNNFSVDSFLNGNILTAQNHKIILDNSKVFEVILDMLNKELSLPKKKK